MVLYAINSAVQKLSRKNPSTGKYHRVCHCDTPCTTSPCGRMVYLYPEKDLRAYPGTVRGTEEWNNTYKIRTTAERSINHLKDSFGVAGRKTQNAKTLHADLILAGITQLISVLLADKYRRTSVYSKSETLDCIELTILKTGVFISLYKCAHFLSNFSLYHYPPCFSVLCDSQYSKIPSFSTILAHILILFRNYLI